MSVQFIASNTGCARGETLLAAHPVFAQFPPAARAELAATLRPQRFPAGQTVVKEGEEGDRLYFIAAGQAEATVTGASGAVPVALLGAGEIFGELALLPGAGRRQATVTALTALETYALPVADFQAQLRAHPRAGEALAVAAETLLRVKFLRQASPFRQIVPARLADLAGKLQSLKVSAGAVIVRQGEPGDACYLLRAGRVEVQSAAGADTRRLATLEPGALFGEAALLTEAPRNASVQALDDCELLVLPRADLIRALGAEQGLGAPLFELYRLRARPVRRENVAVYEHATAEGDPIVILKDAQRGAYFRLSPQGWFVWQRLDGQHSLRDLTLDYFEAFNTFAPEAIAGIVSGLVAAGFTREAPVRRELQQAILSRSQRVLLALHRLLTWRLVFDGADRAVTRLYRGGVHLFYTVAGQAVLAALAVIGVAAFAELQTRTLPLSAARLDAGTLLVFLVPALLLSVVLHEAGHAFTVKAYDREVPRLGIGWYWLSPIAFVDTSDMWRAPRRARMVVSLAGPYVNLLLGGLAAIMGLLVHDATFATTLWVFALLSYLAVLVNLSPLLDYDGYYALADLLDRPRLRADFLAYAYDKLRWRSGVLRNPANARAAWLYGSATFAHLLMVVTLIVLVNELWQAR